MRICIHDEFMEPITIVETPHWRHYNMPDGTTIRVAIMPPYLDIMECPTVFEDIPTEMIMPLKVINLHFVEICRRRSGSKIKGYICWTPEGDDALLLKAAFLPGQQWALSEMSREAFITGFASGLTVALGKR